MSKKRVVVSLGHDALGYTTTEQWDAVKVTAKHWQIWWRLIIS